MHIKRQVRFGKSGCRCEKNIDGLKMVCGIIKKIVWKW